VEKLFHIHCAFAISIILLPGVKATRGFVTALHAVFDRDDRAEKLLFTRSEHR